jgi:hypothetical protein
MLGKHGVMSRNFILHIFLSDDRVWCLGTIMLCRIMLGDTKQSWGDGEGCWVTQ